VIVALFEEQWAAGVDGAFDNVTKGKVDKESAEQVKAAAAAERSESRGELVEAVAQHRYATASIPDPLPG
jgi:hypothetical protein